MVQIICHGGTLYLRLSWFDDNLQSMFSAVQHKTALTDSHWFTRFDASCSVLPVKQLTVLSTASLLEFVFKWRDDKSTTYSAWARPAASHEGRANDH
jgi:hypothetical protein